MINIDTTRLNCARPRLLLPLRRHDKGIASEGMLPSLRALPEASAEGRRKGEEQDPRTRGFVAGADTSLVQDKHTCSYINEFMSILFSSNAFSSDQASSLPAKTPQNCRKLHLLLIRQHPFLPRDKSTFLPLSCSHFPSTSLPFLQSLHLQTSCPAQTASCPATCVPARASHHCPSHAPYLKSLSNLWMCIFSAVLFWKQDSPETPCFLVMEPWPAMECCSCRVARRSPCSWNRTACCWRTLCGRRGG